MRRKQVSWTIWLLALITLLLGVSLLSLISGAAGRWPDQSIVLGIRLPRIILAFAVGGSLSLAGVILQGMFRNPLVEPYTLGISGGAVLGVCLYIILGLRQTLGVVALPLFGFLGASSVIILVYSLSLKKGILKVQGLLLTGVMISFICSSLFMLMMALSRREDLHGMIFWIMGFLEEPNWLLIKLMLAASLALLACAYLFCVPLNALSLGEEEALHLGINVERSKRLLFLVASLLTGFSVAAAGIIGFVGLVVPHLMRVFLGPDHRILLVSSFLSGAVFLIFCDTLARTIIAPLELPVGVITGIIGGSFFVWALNKGRSAVRG